jgi:signal transduction histidine kinase/ActR/RegA family two-component response regulator/HPt (histidine-containing phosphotransfer) domain-containing protein
MSARSPSKWPMSRWKSRHWLTALAVLVTCLLLPLGWVQWQLHQLQQTQAMPAPADTYLQQVGAVEQALARLQTSIAAVDPATPAVPMAALREPYAALVTQARQLQTLPLPSPLPSSPAPSVALRPLAEFFQLADALFTAPEAQPVDFSALDRLTARIDTLQPALDDLAQQARAHAEAATQQRLQRLQRLAAADLALTALLVAGMAWLFVALLRHMRRQYGQFLKLQKLSDQLAQARDQSDAANQGKSLFLANMSHEIRTPFQGLLGMLNLLEEANLSGRHLDYLQTARDSALHLLGVFNDILDVSTIESGTLKLSPTPAHLRDLVKEVEGLMQVTAQDKGLTLDVYTAGDLPEWVMADVTRVRQILFNLISNAIKFTPEGSVIAELTRQPGVADGVVITVRDTGVGMDTETLSHLFTRFHQADNSLRRRAGGSGLGLEISRHLARMMGGDIQVQSQPGVGSVFTITLKLPRTEAPIKDAQPSTFTGAASRRLRVLVAEDHPINLKYMSILLERMGHDAVFCENGQEALDLLKKSPFDAVLLDYHMPVLDGLATTEAIRALPGPAARTKVILVTADVVNDTRKRAIEVGVDEFTSKPLQADDLQRALQYCGLMEGEQTDADGTLQPSRHSNPFPISAYELPVRLPDEQATDLVINIESFVEISSMMPPETLAELLSTLFDPPEGSVPVLLAALENRDMAAVGYNSHKLKGTAMLMGFRAIVRTAGQIEEMVRKGGDPFNSGMAYQLMRDTDLTQKALRQFGLREAP